jgi:hypothetical protein
MAALYGLKALCLIKSQSLGSSRSSDDVVAGLQAAISTPRLACFALVTSAGYIIITVLEHTQRPISRQIPWFNQGEQKIKALCFDPQGNYLAIVTKIGSLHLIPVLELLSPRLNSQAIPLLQEQDITSHPSSKQLLNANSMVWWRQEDGSHVVLVGTVGQVLFVDVATGAIRSKAALSRGPVTRLHLVRNLGVSSTGSTDATLHCIALHNDKCTALLLSRTYVDDMRQRMVDTVFDTDQRQEFAAQATGWKGVKQLDTQYRYSSARERVLVANNDGLVVHTGLTLDDVGYQCSLPNHSNAIAMSHHVTAVGAMQKEGTSKKPKVTLLLSTTAAQVMKYSCHRAT